MSKEPTVIIEPPNTVRVLRQTLAQLAAPPPRMKGMDPKARAAALLADIERRIAVAQRALRHG